MKERHLKDLVSLPNLKGDQTQKKVDCDEITYQKIKDDFAKPLTYLSICSLSSTWLALKL